MSEIWKPVPAWAEYEASDQGRIRRVASASGTRAGRVLKPVDTGRGYRIVSLWRRNKRTNAYVHRLVAAAFLGDGGGLEVNHKDGVKSNNAAENLEYATRQENEQHAARLGLIPRGEARRESKLTAEQVIAIRNAPRSMSQREIAAAYGIAQTTVSKIQRGVQWASCPGTISRRRKEKVA